jgi:hypothetical protein
MCLVADRIEFFVFLFEAFSCGVVFFMFVFWVGKKKYAEGQKKIFLGGLVFLVSVFLGQFFIAIGIEGSCFVFCLCVLGKGIR